MSVLLVLVLSMMLMTTVFAEDTCYVAGTSELCGSAWNAFDPNNAMTLNGNIYEKVYPDLPVGDYQFKVVYNGEWKDNGNDNVLFSVTSACDVTITYDPATGMVGYSGDGVGKTILKVTDIYAVGAKSADAPQWLHGEDWNEKADSNKATKISEGVYSISFDDLPAGTYEFKFAADQAWTHSWGGSFGEFGVTTDAAYNGGNISFTLTEKAKVTLTLDLTNFDIATGGAKFKVALNEDDTIPPDTTGPTEPADPTEPSTTEEEFYVAGCKELCGTQWQANTPANKMTKGSDGIYIKSFDNISKGSYQFKITNGTWETCWGGTGPDGNYEFTITETGKVTIKFDPATKQISVDTVKGQTPEATPSEPVKQEEQSVKYYVSGSGDALGNWDADFPKGLMTKVSAGTYRVTFDNIPAGNYEFKITDGTWDNSWGDNGGNYTFKLETAQKVTITFMLNNGKHDVQVKTEAPVTADMEMLPVVAAALCATMGACLLLMNKKKLI